MCVRASGGDMRMICPDMVLEGIVGMGKGGACCHRRYMACSRYRYRYESPAVERRESHACRTLPSCHWFADPFPMPRLICDSVCSSWVSADVKQWLARFPRRGALEIAGEGPRVWQQRKLLRFTQGGPPVCS